MDPKLFATVFATVFIAELGDKTQLATLVFSSQNAGQRWVVFAAAAGGLVLAAAIGVLAGGVVTRFVTEQQLSLIAGVAFIALGVWTLWQGMSS